MTTSSQVLKAAVTCRVAADGLRDRLRSAPEMEGWYMISKERADLLAALFDDMSQIFDEMAEVIERTEEGRSGRELL
jgi:hypothetical protein